MAFRINPKTLSGTISIIGSKSYGHRALIAASLAEGQSVIRGLPSSNDIDMTLNALEHFGIEFQNELLIGKPWKYDALPIDCKASGSTLRFFIPLAMRLGQDVYFTGEKRLLERPLDVYETVFKTQTFENNGKQIHVKGPLKHGRYKVDGSKSSQFLTGLLFALPQLDNDSVIELTTPLASRSYIDMTLDILKQSGISIVEYKKFFMIQGKQKYKPATYQVEGDYSQAAFFFVAATIGDTIEIKNLNHQSFQGDKEIISIIRAMGGKIKEIENGYICYPKKTKGMRIDLENIPDLGPILMVLAALSKGKTTFTSVERLRYKESDRLEVMMHILKKFGIETSYKHDMLIVYGKEILKGNQTFESYNDHRIAMALAIASIKADGPITINHPEVVNKSYPTFFEAFKTLGGVYDDTE